MRTSKKMAQARTLLLLLLWLLLLGLLLLGVGYTSDGLLADEVVEVDRQGNERRRTGEIIDYRGGRLTMWSGGREISIPSSRIKQIDSVWTAAHRQGDVAFAAGDFPAALDSYRAALQEEPRAWVRRKLLARIIGCERNTQRIADASRRFAELVRDDQETPYFEAIPLAWRVEPPPAAQQKLAESWLGSENGPVKRLIAASWLLTTHRTAAVRTLRQLAKHPRPEISGLARMQFLRTQLVSVTESDVDRWREGVEQLPGHLRAGPYFLLGQAYAQVKETDHAALALLRVPTLFPSHHGLSQAALYEAGRAVEQGGHPAEARVLYRQAAELDAESVLGRQARLRLGELDP